jgi:predicted nucleic acid-binding Zn ribbon protein
MYNNQFFFRYYHGRDALLKVLKEADKKSVYKKTVRTLSWHDYVDEVLADNSEVIDIADNTLTVNVYHSVFKNKLNLQKRQLLEKINRQYPVLQLNKMVIHVVSRPSCPKNEMIKESSFYLAREKSFVKDEEFFHLLDKIKRRAEGEQI